MLDIWCESAGRKTHLKDIKRKGKISLHALSLNAGAGVPSDASESITNLIN